MVGETVRETCLAICMTMMSKHLSLPRTKAEWNKIIDDFYFITDFPNCIGALDGKRFKITQPASSGSLYYDYKGNFSIIMLALVDAKCRFTYVDIGAPGHCSDAGVWNRCDLLKLIEENSLEIPHERKLPDSERSSPMVIVGDDAFPLKTYMMKPWAGQQEDDKKVLFNYR